MFRSALAALAAVVLVGASLIPDNALARRGGGGGGGEPRWRRRLSWRWHACRPCPWRWRAPVAPHRKRPPGPPRLSRGWSARSSGSRLSRWRLSKRIRSGCSGGGCGRCGVLRQLRLLQQWVLSGHLRQHGLPGAILSEYSDMRPQRGPFYSGLLIFYSRDGRLLFKHSRSSPSMIRRLSRASSAGTAACIKSNGHSCSLSPWCKISTSFGGVCRQL